MVTDHSANTWLIISASIPTTHCLFGGASNLKFSVMESAHVKILNTQASSHVSKNKDEQKAPIFSHFPRQRCNECSSAELRTSHISVHLEQTSRLAANAPVISTNSDNIDVSVMFFHISF